MSQVGRVRKLFSSDTADGPVHICGAGALADYQALLRRWFASADKSVDTVAQMLAHMSTDAKGPDGVELEILMITRHGVFFLDAGGAITQPAKGIATIGSGGPFAAGYLAAAVRKGMSRADAVRLARGCLKETAEYAHVVKPPFDVAWI